MISEFIVGFYGMFLLIVLMIIILYLFKLLGKLIFHSDKNLDNMFYGYETSSLPDLSEICAC